MKKATKDHSGDDRLLALMETKESNSGAIDGLNPSVSFSTGKGDIFINQNSVQAFEVLAISTQASDDRKYALSASLFKIESKNKQKVSE